MKAKQLLKAANSKGRLANAVLFYQRALNHYANESNWAVRQPQSDLLHRVGRLAASEGEEWRLAHP